ncbi:MAG: YihA family ribosome biogenesis GTP-binding protein [Oscillospiraceae bacterium]|jgi:GTP-binding protein|nr:YihA family ribosome biogenesis GTP-binding protein [Oscillospiraceae bacterium]MBQ2145732.1 YihA family ribosome biogenesis GTP-binding protein [Oscillospiraceae bacterium]
MTKNLNLNNAVFVTSAASEKQFISSSVKGIAFAGKSNVGKSSVINSLLNRKNLAKTGAQPGKTVHVNYFLIDDRVYFIDLPGYGYAKVSASEKERWGKLMESFFAGNDTYDIGIFIVDARHKPTQNDVTMADYFKSSGKKFAVIANKTDKLKRSEIESNMKLIRETLGLSDDTELIPFSAQSGTGRAEVMNYILNNL